MPALAHKRLVVLGGTSGIGLSAAVAFQAEGAQLVVVGRDDAHWTAARKALSGDVEMLARDATQPATAQEAVDLCVQRFGGLDGLYHVAGGSGRLRGDGPLHQIPDVGWQETLRLNLDSVAWSNRAALRAFLAAQSPGSILNLSSVLATHPSPDHFATHAYAAAKAAILGLSRSLAAYYAPHGIRINVLAPGLVDTPMAQRAARNPTIQAYLRTKQPLDGGRAAIPSDLDAAAVFFLSDASKFVTAQVLAIDGGWSVSEGSPRDTAPFHEPGSEDRSEE